MLFCEKINFTMWSKVHTLPPFFIKQWQAMRLKYLAHTAYSHVPFYRKLWDTRGITPSMIKSIKDLGLLPIVSKTIMKNCAQQEIMYANFKGRYAWKHTSGSTGEPFTFPINAPHTPHRAKVSPYVMSYTFRFLQWRKDPLLDPKSKQLRYMQFKINENELPPNETSVLFFISELRNSPLKLLSKVKRFNPSIVQGMPTILVKFAQIAQKTKGELRPKFPYTISISENLLPAQRQFIEKVFETEVYNCYGTEEFQNIAVECQVHKGMHIFEESFIVEVVDKNDVPVPDGNEGRIIITSFQNIVLPFIRYDTGDWGLILAGTCPCGIPSKRLQIHGRISGFLSFDKGKIHRLEFEKLMYNFADIILRYQLAKVSNERAELRIIPSSKFTKEGEKHICRSFEASFGLKVDIIIGSTGFKKEQNGKPLVFIDKSI